MDMDSRKNRSSCWKGAYGYLRAQKKCVQCRQQDERTLSGRSYCEACRTKNNEAQRRYREHNPDMNRIRSKKYRQDRAKNGLCLDCGKRPPVYGQILCEDCKARRKVSRLKNALKREGNR